MSNPDTYGMCPEDRCYLDLTTNGGQYPVPSCPVHGPPREKVPEELSRTFTKAEKDTIVRIITSGKELTHEVARRYQCRPVDIYRIVTEAQQNDASRGKFPE